MIGLIVLALVQATQAQPFQASPGQPTARDLYVGCYLFLNGTDVPNGADGRAPLFGMKQCGGQILRAIAHEGSSANRDFSFCLPRSVDVDSDPTRAMATAYLSYYERVWANRPDIDGGSAFLVAMMKTWPCPL